MTCAICDHDANTTRLCRPCRADPCNEDWCERWPRTVVSDALAKRERIRSHAAWVDPAEEQTGKRDDVEAMVVALLVNGTPERVQYRDKKGRKRGYYTRTRYLGVRRIATLVSAAMNRHVNYLRVYRLRRRIMRDLQLI
jgi:hypothetical protein